MRLRFPAVTFAMAQPLQGQWHGHYISPLLQSIHMADRATPSAALRPRSTGRLIAGGMLGTAAGLGIGVLAYGAFDGVDPCLTSDCDSNLGTGLVAVTAGLTIMTPLGVHLADSRRGSFLKGLLVSTGVATLGWGGAALTQDRRWLLPIPPAQIAAAILAARSSVH